MSPKTVLFICSGNFYRSRYAEAIFNHTAADSLPDWKAFSRGFKPHLATEDLSYLARERLEGKNIPLHRTAAKPVKLEPEDLVGAELVIGMLEPQHRPLMEERFPEFAGKVEYWQVYDIEDEPPEVSLPLIDENVAELLAGLT